MRKASIAFILISALVSLPAFAQQGAPSPSAPPKDDAQRFAQTKERLLKALDARIDRLQKSRSCVNDAKDADALRACRPQPQKGAR